MVRAPRALVAALVVRPDMRPTMITVVWLTAVAVAYLVGMLTTEAIYQYRAAEAAKLGIKPTFPMPVVDKLKNCPAIREAWWQCRTRERMEKVKSNES